MAAAKPAADPAADPAAGAGRLVVVVLLLLVVVVVVVVRVRVLALPVDVLADSVRVLGSGQVLLQAAPQDILGRTREQFWKKRSKAK